MKFLLSYEVATKHNHLIPSFQMIDINLNCEYVEKLADHLNIFKIMKTENDKSANRLNKRLFSDSADDHVTDDELIKAEIEFTSKKKRNN